MRIQKDYKLYNIYLIIHLSVEWLISKARVYVQTSKQKASALETEH